MDENSGTNLAEYVAILSGNTDLLDKVKIEKQIAGLESENKLSTVLNIVLSTNLKIIRQN